MLNFQDMIAKLIQFWVDQGCVAHQGYDLEVGAGTFNPATFLRALGPEPYSAVYVEPSRRPQDGRYGENPNRVQHYHQMQVILKPSPSNILELYIQSLESIGLNLKEHDIRFVHDDWENPTIGAAGLGWEIWLDGMEITQFTYFQVIGSLPVKPVSGEITYGLERIAMYLQGVDSMFDIKWNDEITYGDIFKRSEWEWSHYNFNEASIEMWHRHFDDFEREAKKLLAASLPIPAYDFVMKASHSFNILEARGVVSVTERTGYITRIRNLARELAEKYVELRKKLHFPLLKENHRTSAKKSIPIEPLDHPSESASFLLEIGSEELPHSFVPIGLNQLEKKMRSFLEENALKFKDIKTYGTPRRLAILVEDLSVGSLPKKIEKKGPSLSLAFDEKGHLTQIGESFFRSLGINNLSLDEIKSGTHLVTLRTIKETPYLFASFEEKEKSTKELLSQCLPDLILDLNFPKKMRWSDFDIEYARPLRWIVSLYGKDVIPFSLFDVTADRISFGHRQIDPDFFSINSADEYLYTLRRHHVMVDHKERKTFIENSLRKIEEENQVTIVSESKVLPIVLHLVEWPFILEGHFDPQYLKAPQEVLISEMVEHQKYFPLQNKGDGSLAPRFIIVANNYPTEKIKQGNEKALAPRLCDGLFLYEEDTKMPLEHFNEKLKTLTFQKELGSVYAKVKRLTQIAQILHHYLPLCSLDKLLRAAHLCKADLTTELVQEFPELQGTIGEHYALKSQEDPEVASSIREHWMPTGEQATLPQSTLGIILSISDKIDNFISCFSIGLIPTSSSDPYALRRQAMGIIKMTIENKLSFPFQDIFQKSFDIFLQNPEMEKGLKSKIEAQKEKILKDIEDFFKNRLKTVFSDLNFQKDEIEAVLAKSLKNIFSTYQLLEALHNFRHKENVAFCKTLTVYTRAKKILNSQKHSSLTPPNSLLFVENAEKELFHKLNEVQKEFNKSYEGAFHLLSQIEPLLAKLFDTVTIIHEDENLKNNRLSLLQNVLVQCEELIDFGKIQEHSS